MLPWLSRQWSDKGQSIYKRKQLRTIPTQGFRNEKAIRLVLEVHAGIVGPFVEQMSRTGEGAAKCARTVAETSLRWAEVVVHDQKKYATTDYMA